MKKEQFIEEQLNKMLESTKDVVSEEKLVETLSKYMDDMARYDRALGIPEDAPADFRLAVRNMGPVTRMMFLKRFNAPGKMRNGKPRQTMTEERYRQYIDHYAGKGEAQ